MSYPAQRLTIDFCEWVSSKFGVMFNRLSMYRIHGVGRVQDFREINRNFKQYIQESLESLDQRPIESEEVYADTSELEDTPMFTIEVPMPKTLWTRIMKWVQGWFK